MQSLNKALGINDTQHPLFGIDIIIASLFVDTGKLGQDVIRGTSWFMTTLQEFLGDMGLFGIDTGPTHD